ncbi:MAG TPA: hemerythrin domain-containing protein [Paralcaligenes sp.]
MNTPFPGFSTPSAGTEAPLEMLSACHIRIEHQCATLKRLAAHLTEHGADDQARQAAANILRYFDTAAPQHHADEEENVFPALIESMAGSDAVCIHQMIEGLTADHRALEAGWRGLRRALERITEGQTAELPASELAKFVELYERHLKIEDDDLLPMAARLLADDELDHIGQAMRKRRGIDAL